MASTAKMPLESSVSGYLNVSINKPSADDLQMKKRLFVGPLNMTNPYPHARGPFSSLACDFALPEGHVLWAPTDSLSVSYFWFEEAHSPARSRISRNSRGLKENASELWPKAGFFKQPTTNAENKYQHSHDRNWPNKIGLYPVL